MPVVAQEYEVEHLIKFLKEEFERIIVRCGRASGHSVVLPAKTGQLS